MRGPTEAPQVLLQLRGPDTTYMAGHWATAAAGHIEAGESVFEAAAREAQEELGVRVPLEAMDPLCGMHRTLRDVDDAVEQRIDFFLTTRQWEGEPSIQEPGKCLELGWFSLGELPTSVVPHERYLLVLLAEGVVPPILTHGF